MAASVHLLDDSTSEALAEAELAVSEQTSITRSAGVVSLATLISRLTGLVREIFLAHIFGAGYLNDAFQLGFRIPNLLRDLFAEGAFSSAFIPTFAGVWKSQGREEAAALANSVFTALLTAAVTVAALSCWFAPELVSLLAPGFAQVPGKFDLAVLLTRIMCPFLVFISVAAQAGGILNAAGRFGRAALSSAFFNIGSVVVGFVLGFLMGPSFGISRVVGMAVGITAGGLLQLLWQLPSVWRNGFSLRLRFHAPHPAVKTVGVLMLPAVVTTIAVQLNVVVTSAFASSIADPIRGLNGPVSWLSFAFRLVHLPLGLFGVAIASAALPSIARSAAVRDILAFRTTVAHALTLVLLFTLPSTLILVVLSKPLVGAIYQSGRFAEYDTEQTALALSFYALGLTAYAAIRLLGSAFYALADAWRPMYITLGSVLLNAALPFLLIHRWHFGFAALAASAAASSLLECILFAELLRRRLGSINGLYLLDRAKRIVAACAVTLAPLYAVYWLATLQTSATRLGYLLQLAVCLPFGAFVFWWTCRLFGIAEIRALEEMFVWPVRRSWAAAHAKLRV